MKSSYYKTRNFHWGAKHFYTFTVDATDLSTDDLLDTLAGYIKEAIGERRGAEG